MFVCVCVCVCVCVFVCVYMCMCHFMCLLLALAFSLVLFFFEERIKISCKVTWSELRCVLYWSLTYCSYDIKWWFAVQVSSVLMAFWGIWWAKTIPSFHLRNLTSQMTWTSHCHIISSILLTTHIWLVSQVTYYWASQLSIEASEVFLGYACLEYCPVVCHSLLSSCRTVEFINVFQATSWQENHQ